MWSWLRTLAYILPQLLQSMIKGPRTVRFPFAPADMPEGYRGRVAIKAENCRGCSLCVRDCPANALELYKESRETYRLIHHPDRCAYCGQCALSCNFDAIYLDNQFVHGTPQREALTVVLVSKSPSTSHPV